MKIRFLQNLSVSAGPYAARAIIRSLKSSMRIDYVNFDAYKSHLSSGKQMILAFWHGRLLMMPYSYPGRGITILVSASRDGEIISKTVESFGIASVRGSSSRGWFAGVKGLLQSVRNGRDVAITPDGPRGPARIAQMGAIQIARSTGLPIFPMSFGASKKKPLAAGIASWCRIRSLGAYTSAASLSAWARTSTRQAWSGPGSDSKKP